MLHEKAGLVIIGSGKASNMRSAVEPNSFEPALLRACTNRADTDRYRQARSRHADLIALGTHSRSVVSQMLPGSIARNVLQAAIRR